MIHETVVRFKQRYGENLSIGELWQQIPYIALESSLAFDCFVSPGDIKAWYEGELITLTIGLMTSEELRIFAFHCCLLLFSSSSLSSDVSLTYCANANCLLCPIRGMGCENAARLAGRMHFGVHSGISCMALVAEVYCSSTEPICLSAAIATLEPHCHFSMLFASCANNRLAVRTSIGAISFLFLLGAFPMSTVVRFSASFASEKAANRLR